MAVRGIRGATTVGRNEAAAIVERTLELLRVLVQSNSLRPEDVASAVFTNGCDVRSALGSDDVVLPMKLSSSTPERAVCASVLPTIPNL